MGNLFGKKKQQPTRVTDQDKAVLQLKQQRDKLKLYKKKISNQLDQEREMAKKLIQEGKKDKALLLLRKKKYQENLLNNTDSQLENIEKLTQDIEFAQVEAQVLEGLQAGNSALKTLHECLSLEKVEQIMDETREAVEYQNEIDAILSGGLSAQDEVDVEGELDALLAADIGSDLPAVPQDELPEAEATEDKPVREKRPKKQVLEAS